MNCEFCNRNIKTKKYKVSGQWLCEICAQTVPVGVLQSHDQESLWEYIIDLKYELENKKLKPGYCTEVEYIRVIDGDTVEVEFRRRFNIRINDFDAPEKKTHRGQEALDFIDELLNDADEVLINIDLGDTLKLMDFNSFERIVADVEVDGESLRDIMIANGFEK